MLYDKRWDAAPATKPADPFTLPALIAWLETMPKRESYNYYCMGECLLGQWVTTIDPSAKGYPVIIDGGDEPYFYNVNGVERDLRSFGDIAVSEPWTFGAALTRAREALADQVFRALADGSPEAVR